MGKWTQAVERVRNRRPLPQWERDTEAQIADLKKAVEARRAHDYTTAKSAAEARHLPLMQQYEAGGLGPRKMMGASFEILRAFARLNPDVGAAVSIRQREVGSSKWRIVPDLEGHKDELDLLRQVVMGVRHFSDIDGLQAKFKPQYLKQKMVRDLIQATIKPDGLTPSEVRYRFRLAYMELLIEAHAHSRQVKQLLEHPNQTGDTDSWSELLKGIVPDLLILDCAAIELRRADQPRDMFDHTLPTSPIIEMGWVDGATIRPVLDDHGQLRVPTEDQPNACAYEQWIEGQVVTQFQRHNLIRFIENPQTDIMFRGYGFSRVEYLMMTMILESHGDKAKLEEFKRAFYGGFLNLKSKSWMQEDIDSFRGYVEEQLEGNRKLPILAFPDGAEWINTTMNQGSSNNGVDQRKMHRERVCAIFEMPPVKLGMTDTSNYSTSEISQEAGDEGLRHVLDVLDRGITRWIVRDAGFGSYPYLKYESRAANEREGKDELEQLKLEMEMGLTLPNEARMERGDGPIEGGDQPYTYFQEYHKAKGQADGMGGEGQEAEEDGVDGDEDPDNPGEQEAQDDGAFQGEKGKDGEGGSNDKGGPSGFPQSFASKSRPIGDSGEDDDEDPDLEKALGPIREQFKEQHRIHGAYPALDIEVVG